jgi:hypothetical protein
VKVTKRISIGKFGMIRVGVEDVHPHGLERVRFYVLVTLRE